MYYNIFLCYFFFFKQKTAYEMRISDWSSDVCSSDLKEVQVFGTWRNWFKDLGTEVDEAKGAVFSSYNMMLQEVIAGYGVGLGWAKMVDLQIEDRKSVV